MTLRTITQYLMRNARTGETDPRRWLNQYLAINIASARSRWVGEWQVYTELLVIQPEADRE